MPCRSYKGNMEFCLAKDGSIHQAQICDMVRERYHHRPDNGLILWFKFGHSKNFFYIFYYGFRGAWIQQHSAALSFLNSIYQFLLLNKQFEEKCVHMAVHPWHERQMSLPSYRGLITHLTLPVMQAMGCRVTD